MAYSDFDLRKAVDTFGLTERRDLDLFHDVPAVEPAPWLRDWLAEHLPIAMAVNSEFARSTYIVTPVLAEIHRHVTGPLNVLPGVTFDVDRGRGLNGVCDYLLSRFAGYYYLRGPIVAVVEAKREDLISGFGQCTAAMVGIREFNDKDGTHLPAVYGAVTSGTNWRFLRLTGPELVIDRVEYYIQDVGKIVGILAHLAGTAPPVGGP